MESSRIFGVFPPVELPPQPYVGRSAYAPIPRRKFRASEGHYEWLRTNTEPWIERTEAQIRQLIEARARQTLRRTQSLFVESTSSDSARREGTEDEDEEMDDDTAGQPSSIPPRGRGRKRGATR
ncbi:hypothetical protein T439DRAFT_90734 [Meredithblackwellia eburnea MCA 4105]